LQLSAMDFSNSIRQQLVAYETTSTKKIQMLHKILESIFIYKENIMMHFQSRWKSSLVEHFQNEKLGIN
jgi:hypothetical protein